MKNKIETLTEKELKMLQKTGYLPDMELKDIEGDPEGELWIAVKNSAAQNIFDYAATVQDATGWTDRDADEYARNTWKTAKKLIASFK